MCTHYAHKQELHVNAVAAELRLVLVCIYAISGVRHRIERRDVYYPIRYLTVHIPAFQPPPLSSDLPVTSHDNDYEAARLFLLGEGKLLFLADPEEDMPGIQTS